MDGSDQDDEVGVYDGRRETGGAGGGDGGRGTSWVGRSTLCFIITW